MARKTKKAAKKKSAVKKKAPSKKSVVKKKAVKKRTSKTAAMKALNSQEVGYMRTFQDLQKQIKQAWADLRKDVEKGTSIAAINKGTNKLMLLLGECNYLAAEYDKYEKRRNA